MEDATKWMMKPVVVRDMMMRIIDGKIRDIKIRRDMFPMEAENTGVMLAAKTAAQPPILHNVRPALMVSY